MTEDEILIRAREACCHSDYTISDYAGIRAGSYDGHATLLCIHRALRDLDKPLREIVPVDPDLIAARNVVSAHWLALDCLSNAEDARRGEDDGLAIVQCALAGIRAGKAMRS